jgi:ribosomal protein L37E
VKRIQTGFEMTTKAHPIYRNAINAIQVAVEDFNEGTSERIASAVRSLTSGLLLLCKEKLRRLSPDDEILIWKNIKPALSENGELNFKKSGQTTVDVQDIKERFNSFGIQCDTKLLQRVADVRNAVEHHYVEDVAQIRGAFVDGLRFLSKFMPEHLNVEPRDALDASVWETLIRQKEIEDALRAECRTSYKDIDWPPLLKEAIENVGCPECRSPLVRQIKLDNTDAFSTTWECAACGHQEGAREWVGKIIPEYYATECFVAAKDGDSSPIDGCPECGEETFIYKISQCVACGFELEDTGECAICGETLDLEDYDETLCSYHRHVAEKERDR